MMAIPAVDLRDGACVQLVGGSYDEERVRLDDPLDVARGWARLGFRRLQLVDLDAATGRGENMTLVRAILAERTMAIQVGGGVRSGEAIERRLQEGADRVIVGTRAVEDPQWLAGTATAFPGKLIVAADVRGRCVVTRGWARTLARDVLDLVAELNELPLAALLVTAVHREGQLAGTDLLLMRAVAARSAHPVLASGGVSSMDELRALADDGVAGTVLGMALYTGVLDARLVAEEFVA